MLKFVPADIRAHLERGREDYTLSHYVTQLFRTQKLIADTLNADNEPGKMIQVMLGGKKPLTEMPGPRGTKVVPISPEEQKLYEECKELRKALASQGVNFSLEGWHIPGASGDGFAGPRGRIPKASQLDPEHLPMMARTFGFTGLAVHSWLDVHPDDMRAISLNLVERGLKFNSIFHGAFHGPTFSRGAMSNENPAIRHLAHLLKLEGQIYSTLGFDPATAIEEGLIEHIGRENVDNIRKNNLIVLALEEAKKGKRDLATILKQEVMGLLNIKGGHDAVDRLMGTVMGKPGCTEVCDWDGTDGLMLSEQWTKSRSSLGLRDDEITPSLDDYRAGQRIDPNQQVSRLDLLIEEKARRIVASGGLTRIKIEPKFHDPSDMIESSVEVVKDIKEGVEKKIKDWIGAMMYAEKAKWDKDDFDRELQSRFKPYEDRITIQIEEGHSVQNPIRPASTDVEKALQWGILADAYHENFSPPASGYGDPDFTIQVNPDMVKRLYALIKAGRLGPDSDPQKRMTIEFDMAPHFWDPVYGWLQAMRAVNQGIGQAMNVIKIENAMKATGQLSDYERYIQETMGTLDQDRGIYQQLDTGRIFNATNEPAPSLEELKPVQVHTMAKRFREEVAHRPYTIDMTSRQVMENLKQGGVDVDVNSWQLN